MQIDRLFTMTYLLLERGSMTARELADYFEVSPRTIYRDLDVLSGAGIPVYASKGRGGGVRLLPDFIIDRSLLSKPERRSLLAGLQSMSALELPEAKSVLQKLGALFQERAETWLDVDFTHWGAGRLVREQFAALRNAVMEKRVLRFVYYSARGERAVRTVEPLKILFKGAGWYLYGYCRTRGDYRFFKLCRMEAVESTGECFTRTCPDQISAQQSFDGPTVRVVLRFEPELAFRVCDEFSPGQTERQPDGSFLATAEFPVGEWLYSYIMSFGPQAELLEPHSVREQLAERLGRAADRYREDRTQEDCHGQA